MGVYPKPGGWGIAFPKIRRYYVLAVFDVLSQFVRRWTNATSKEEPEERIVTGSVELNRTAQIAQLVEHVLGKDEVTGSIPVLGFEDGKAKFGSEKAKDEVIPISRDSGL